MCKIKHSSEANSYSCWKDVKDALGSVHSLMLQSKDFVFVRKRFCYSAYPPPWILPREEKNVLVRVSKSYSVVSLLQAHQEQHFALCLLQPWSCREDLFLNCSVDVTRTMEEKTAMWMINSQPIPYLSGICCSSWMKISVWGSIELIPGYSKGWLTSSWDLSQLLFQKSWESGEIPLTGIWQTLSPFPIRVRKKILVTRGLSVSLQWLTVQPQRGTVKGLHRAGSSHWRGSARLHLRDGSLQRFHQLLGCGLAFYAALE